MIIDNGTDKHPYEAEGCPGEEPEWATEESFEEQADRYEKLYREVERKLNTLVLFVYYLSARRDTKAVRMMEYEAEKIVNGVIEEFETLKKNNGVPF